MFFYYTRALALSILTLTGSLLYTAEQQPTFEQETQPTPQQPYYGQPQPQYPTQPPTTAGKPSIILMVAKNPSNNLVSVLLAHKKKGYWSGIKSRDENNEIGNIHNVLLAGTEELIDTPQSTIYVSPVQFKTVDDLRRTVKENTLFDDFVWVPLAEVTGKTSPLAKTLSPFAQKSAIGKTSTALLDSQTQKAIQQAASRISAAVGALQGATRPYQQPLQQPIQYPQVQQFLIRQQGQPSIYQQPEQTVVGGEELRPEMEGQSQQYQQYQQQQPYWQ